MLFSFLVFYYFFLLQDIGPVIDCEIDDDNDEPNYLSKNKNFKNRNI